MVSDLGRGLVDGQGRRFCVTAMHLADRVGLDADDLLLGLADQVFGRP